MKRLLTILCAMLMLCTAVQAEGDFMKNARNIPEELAAVPESYKRPAERQGMLELLTCWSVQTPCCTWSGTSPER